MRELCWTILHIFDWRRFIAIANAAFVVDSVDLNLLSMYIMPYGIILERYLIQHVIVLSILIIRN